MELGYGAARSGLQCNDDELLGLSFEALGTPRHSRQLSLRSGEGKMKLSEALCLPLYSFGMKRPYYVYPIPCSSRMVH